MGTSHRHKASVLGEPNWGKASQSMTSTALAVEGIDCNKIPMSLGVSFREMLKNCQTEDKDKIMQLLATNRKLVNTINID